MGKHVAYPFKIDANITALRPAVKELVNRKLDVQNKIAETNKHGNSPANALRDWVERVEKVEVHSPCQLRLQDQQKCQEKNLWM
jgi:hypothetical protein